MRSATSKISLVNDATVLPFFEACAASDCAVSDSTGISCFVMRPWLRREYVHQAMRPECTDGSRHSLGTQRRGAAPESFTRVSAAQSGRRTARRADAKQPPLALPTAYAYIHLFNPTNIATYEYTSA